MLKSRSYKQYENLMNKMPYLFLEVGLLYFCREKEEQKQQVKPKNKINQKSLGCSWRIRKVPVLAQVLAGHLWLTVNSRWRIPIPVAHSSLSRAGTKDRQLGASLGKAAADVSVLCTNHHHPKHQAHSPWSLSACRSLYLDHTWRFTSLLPPPPAGLCSNVTFSGGLPRTSN